MVNGFDIPAGGGYKWLPGTAVFYLFPNLPFPGTGINGQIMNDLTFSAYQKRVDQWIRTHGVRYFSELTNTAILMEEVGEVARIMARRYGDQSAKSDGAEADLGDELADVLFVLCCLANQTGIDLTRAIHRNLDKKTRRDHRRHHQNPKLGRPDDPVKREMES